MGIEVTGLVGLLILIGDIYAIVNIFQSHGSTGSKVLWILLVLVFPLVGLLIWFVAGPKSGR